MIATQELPKSYQKLCLAIIIGASCLGQNLLRCFISREYFNGRKRPLMIATTGEDSWNRTFKDMLGNDAFTAVHHKYKGKDSEWVYWDAHHLVPSTVLTHALAQGDL